jgi:hypothetical protein
LREAGFEANQRKMAYPREYRAEQMIALIRELGHFPTRAEMRLKRRTDPAFPDANIYYRLGNRAAIVEFIQDSCSGREEYADIVDVCNPSRLAKQSPDSRVTSDPDLGFVYLLKSGRFYKIGRSNAAGRRERELAIQLPNKGNHHA